MSFEATCIIAGLIIGWAKKGSIWSITELRLKWIWVLPASFIVQHASMMYLKGTWYEVTLVLSYLSLIAFCGINFRTPGLPWTLLGTVLNFIVMLVNGLRMPAYLPVVRAVDPGMVGALMKGDIGKSIAMTGSTHLNFLGDIFYFRVQPASLFSVGDVVFAIGLAMLIQYSMCLKRGVESVGTA